MSRHHRPYGHDQHRCDDPFVEAPVWAVELKAMGLYIIQLLEFIMAEIDNLEASVKANTDAEDSAEALLIGISKQIADLKAAGTDPATAARIQAASDLLSARAAKLAAAVVANTPAA